MKTLFTLAALTLFVAQVAIAQDTEPVSTNPNPSIGSPAGPLTTDVEDLNNQFPVQIYSFGNEVFINAPKHSTVSGSVMIYELTGRLVYRADLQNQNLNKVVSPNMAGSYYLVDVTLNGERYRSKVFVK